MIYLKGFQQNFCERKRKTAECQKGTGGVISLNLLIALSIKNLEFPLRTGLKTKARRPVQISLGKKQQ